SHPDFSGARPARRIRSLAPELLPGPACSVAAHEENPFPRRQQKILPGAGTPLDRLEVMRHMQGVIDQIGGPSPARVGWGMIEQNSHAISFSVLVSFPMERDDQ